MSDQHEVVSFHGGPLDGQTKSVSRYLDFVRHYDPPALRFTARPEPVNSVHGLPAYRIHRYKRRGSTKDFYHVG